MKPRLAISRPVDELDARLSAAKQHEAGATIWEPPGATTTIQPPAATIPNEQTLIHVIRTPIGADEGHRSGNDRKERELAALFDTLTPAESLALSKRLEAPVADDPLADAFSRLVAERRMRLLSRLRRRRAIAATIAQQKHRASTG